MQRSLATLLALCCGLGDGPTDELPFRGIERPEYERPQGLPLEFVEPGFNRFDAERWELGRKLFYDPLLSIDRTVSCASCHKPEYAFADPARFSDGVRGYVTERNTPTLLNRGFADVQMWDGAARSLEEQALTPIYNFKEMGLPLKEAVRRLAEHAEYGPTFRKVFGREICVEDLGMALAQYVRRLTFGGTPVDRFRDGDAAALSSLERAGLWIFESKGGCWRCHSGPNFSDEGFHATGIGLQDGELELGRADVSGREEEHGAFKTPTLRGLAFSAPYMHDGSLASLEEVIEYYARGGNAHPGLDPKLRPFALDEHEKAALVAFLRALSRPAP